MTVIIRLLLFLGLFTSLSCSSPNTSVEAIELFHEKLLTATEPEDVQSLMIKGGGLKDPAATRERLVEKKIFLTDGAQFKLNDGVVVKVSVEERPGESADAYERVIAYHPSAKESAVEYGVALIDGDWKISWFYQEVGGKI